MFRPRLLIRRKYRPRNTMSQGTAKNTSQCQLTLRRSVASRVVQPSTSRELHGLSTSLKEEGRSCSLERSRADIRSILYRADAGSFQVMIERNRASQPPLVTPGITPPQLDMTVTHSARGQRYKSHHMFYPQGRKPAACIASQKRQLGYLDFPNAAGSDLVVLTRMHVSLAVNE